MQIIDREKPVNQVFAMVSTCSKWSPRACRFGTVRTPGHVWRLPGAPVLREWSGHVFGMRLAIDLGGQWMRFWAAKAGRQAGMHACLHTHVHTRHTHQQLSERERLRANYIHPVVGHGSPWGNAARHGCTCFFACIVVLHPLKLQRHWCINTGQA